MFLDYITFFFLLCYDAGGFSIYYYYYNIILVQNCQQVASAFIDALQATKMTHVFYLLVPTSGKFLHSSPGMTYLMTQLSANKHTKTGESSWFVTSAQCHHLTQPGLTLNRLSLLYLDQESMGSSHFSY